MKKDIKNLVILFTNLSLYIITYCLIAFSHALVQPESTSIVNGKLLETYAESYYSSYNYLIVGLLLLFLINSILYFLYKPKTKVYVRILFCFSFILTAYAVM